MKPGDLVRNAKAHDWGVGVVIVTVDDKLRVNFEGRGVVVVKPTPGLLVSVSPTDVDPASWLHDPERWHEGELPPERRSKKAAPPCQHCGLKLNRGLHSHDRRLKSCPRCSTEDGTQHVFYETPAAFGTSERRESDGTPEGTQSYCVACRTGAGADFTAHGCATVRQ